MLVCGQLMKEKLLNLLENGGTPTLRHPVVASTTSNVKTTWRSAGNAAKTVLSIRWPQPNGTAPYPSLEKTSLRKKSSAILFKQLLIKHTIFHGSKSSGRKTCKFKGESSFVLLHQRHWEPSATDHWKIQKLHVFWMVSEAFMEFLCAHNSKLRAESRHVVLLLDRCSTCSATL